MPGQRDLAASLVSAPWPRNPHRSEISRTARRPQRDRWLAGVVCPSLHNPAGTAARNHPEMCARARSVLKSLFPNGPGICSIAGLVRI